MNPEIQTSQQDPFVGREQELRTLIEAFDAAEAGQGRAIMLVGEPGIGKSRIAEELGRHAAERGAFVFSGWSMEEQSAPAFWPWIQILRSCVSILSQDELRATLGSAAGAIAEVVPTIREKLDDIEAPPVVNDPDAARFRFFDSVARFLQSISRSRPLVVVLDDLHWADEASLELLRFVVRSLAESRVLLVGTYRDVELRRGHPLYRLLGDLNRQRLFQRVLLRGLSVDEVARYMELIAAAKPSEQIVRAVFENTEGTPFFVGETVRLLALEGSIKNTDDLQHLRLPEGVREVIGRRLDRLSPAVNDLLTHAAMLGREFPFAVLRLMTERDEGDLLDALDELVNQRLIEEDRERAGVYCFAHALVRQTILEELSITKRARFHGRIAKALESYYGDQASRHAAQLAYHYANAEIVVEKADVVRWTRTVAEQSLVAGAYEGARRWFRRSLECLGDEVTDEVHAELLFELAKTESMLQMEHALEPALAAFGYFEKTGANDRAMAVASFPFYFGLGEQTVGALDMTRRALQIVPETHPQRAQLLLQHALFLDSENADHRAAMDAVQAAVDAAERMGATELVVLGSAGRVVGQFLQGGGRVPLWDRGVAERAYRQACEGGDLAQEVATLSALLRQILMSGFDPPAPPEYAREGLRHARKSPAHPHRLCVPAFTYFMTRADWGSARDAIETVGDEWANVADAMTLRLEHQLGNVEAAHAALRSFLAWPEYRDPDHLPPHFVLHHVIVDASLLSYTARDSRYDSEIERIARFSVSRFPWIGRQHASHAALGLIAVAQNNREAAAAEYQALTAQRRPPLFGPTSSDRVLGLLAMTAGQIDAAVEHLQTARDYLRRIDYLPELGWVLLGLADALSARVSLDRERVSNLYREAQALGERFSMRLLEERGRHSLALLDGATGDPVFPDQLSGREVEVLQLMSRGFTNQDIGGALSISSRTVATHARHIYEKTGTANRAEATAYAVRQGLAGEGD